MNISHWTKKRLNNSIHIFLLSTKGSSFSFCILFSVQRKHSNKEKLKMQHISNASNTKCNRYSKSYSYIGGVTYQSQHFLKVAPEWCLHSLKMTNTKLRRTAIRTKLKMGPVFRRELGPQCS